MRVTDLLRDDHQRVHDLFLEVEATGDGQRRQELLDTIHEELEIHAQAEEELVYPAFRQASDRIDDAVHGHQHMRSVMGQVQGLDPGAEDFRDRLLQLKQTVIVHVMEEEGGVFLDAARLGLEELERLGREVERRKEELRASLLQRGKRAVKQAAQKIA